MSQGGVCVCLKVYCVYVCLKVDCVWVSQGGVCVCVSQGLLCVCLKVECVCLKVNCEFNDFVLPVLDIITITARVGGFFDKLCT